MNADELHGKAKSLLDDSEWDFRTVPESQLEECFRWEWPRSRPDIVKKVEDWRHKGSDLAEFKNYVKAPPRKTDTIPLHDPTGSLTWFCSPLWPGKAWRKSGRPTVARLTGSTAFSGPVQVELLESPALNLTSRPDLLRKAGSSSLVVCVRGWPLTLGEVQRELAKQWRKFVKGAPRPPKSDEASNSQRHRLVE